MIITIGSNTYEVDVLNSFETLMNRSIKFKRTVSGSLYYYDRGFSHDKITAKITIIGDISFLKPIVGDIKNNKESITIVDGIYPILGTAINDNNFYITNSTLSNPIRDNKTATLNIDLASRFTSLIINQSTFPDIRFPYPVNRVIDRNYNFFHGNYNYSEIGTNSLVDNSNVIQQYETVSFSTNLCDDELKELQSFYLYNRAQPFLLTTNSILELFYDTNSCNVIFTDMKIKHRDYNSWDVNVTLSKV